MKNHLKIHYEDNHLLVVEKPAGVIVQKDSTGDTSLQDMGKQYLKETYDYTGEVFLGLMSRIDRPASGIVVMAKTSKSASRLTDQFKKSTPRKIYQILVEGHPPKKGKYYDKIYRKGATSYISENKSKGKDSNLTFRTLKSTNDISQVQVNMKTGRHHQIRVQFDHRGYPILGDFRYGSNTKFPYRAIALHAKELTILHPISQEPLTFNSEVPDYWPKII